MKFHFILNPKAGTGKKIEELSKNIKQVCEECCVDYNIHITSAPADATEYVKAAVLSYDGSQRFYACGGDGTLCEIINGAPNNDKVEFGLIPTGTGNDFRRNFSNKEMFFDIKRQIEGQSEKIDLLKCNDKYCVNIINIGFDCNVVDEMGKIKNLKFIPNKLAYIGGIVVTLFKKMCTKMKITANDLPQINRDILLIAIANGKFYGGGFKAAPYASLHDSKIDVSIVEKISRATFISLVGKYKKGEHLDTAIGKKCVTYFKTDSLSIEFDQERKICIDGELETRQKLDISIEHDCVSFIIPKGSQELNNANTLADDIKIINCSSLVH